MKNFSVFLKVIFNWAIFSMNLVPKYLLLCHVTSLIIYRREFYTNNGQFGGCVIKIIYYICNVSV